MPGHKEMHNTLGCRRKLTTFPSFKPGVYSAVKSEIGRRQKLKVVDTSLKFTSGLKKKKPPTLILHANKTFATTPLNGILHWKLMLGYHYNVLDLDATNGVIK